MLLNNQWVIKEIRRNKKCPETNKNKYDISKSMGCSKGVSKREDYSSKHLPKQEKLELNYITLYVKELEKEQIKP